MILRTLAVILAMAGMGRQTSLLYVQCGEGVKWFSVDARTGAMTGDALAQWASALTRGV